MPLGGFFVALRYTGWSERLLTNLKERANMEDEGLVSQWTRQGYEKAEKMRQRYAFMRTQTAYTSAVSDFALRRVVHCPAAGCRTPLMRATVIWR